MVPSTLQWINADSAKQPDVRKVVRSQATKHQRNRQRRERRQLHSEHVVRELKVSQRRIPGLDVEILEKPHDYTSAASSDLAGSFESFAPTSLHGESVEEGDSPGDKSTHDRNLTCRASESGRTPCNRVDAAASIQMIPGYPSTWGKETVDPFSSPAQVVATWMRPELRADDAEKIIARAWEKAPNRMTLSSLTLAAAAFLDAVDMEPDSSMRNVALYKQAALREVGLRLRCASTATSDETITCLGNIISFEVSTLSPDATVHLRGLKALLEVKGGKTKLNLAGLTMMIESLDLLNALIHHENPVLTSPNVQPPQADEKIHSAVGIFYAVQQELDALDPAKHRCHIERLAGFGALLASATQAVCSPRKQVGGQSSCDRFFATLHTFSPNRPDLDTDADEVPWMRIAIAHVMAMVFNVFANGHEMRDKHNAEHVQWLSVALRSVDEAVLEDLPTLKVWLLLMGVAASMDPTRTSFFSARLSLHCYQRGWRQWDSATKGLFELVLRLSRSKDAVAPDHQAFIRPGAFRSLKNRSTTPPGMSPIQAARDGNELLARDLMFMRSLYDSDWWFTKTQEPGMDR